MSEPSLDFQKAIRARLIATAGVTALVPAANILDRNARPELSSCILVGEGYTAPGDGLARVRHAAFADLHIWQTEPGLAQAKAIAGAIRQAFATPLRTLDHYFVADLLITASRFMRDPDGIHSHGIVSLSAQLVETA